MAGKPVIKPVVPVLLIGNDGAAQAGNDQPQAAARFEHPGAFPQNVLQFVGIEVLEHVRGIDRLDRTTGKRQPTAHVQPEIKLLQRIRVNVVVVKNPDSQ